MCLSILAPENIGIFTSKHQSLSILRVINMHLQHLIGADIQIGIHWTLAWSTVSKMSLGSLQFLNWNGPWLQVHFLSAVNKAMDVGKSFSYHGVPRTRFQQM